MGKQWDAKQYWRYCTRAHTHTRARCSYIQYPIYIYTGAAPLDFRRKWVSVYVCRYNSNNNNNTIILLYKIIYICTNRLGGVVIAGRRRRRRRRESAVHLRPVLDIYELYSYVHTRTKKMWLKKPFKWLFDTKMLMRYSDSRTHRIAGKSPYEFGWCVTMVIIITTYVMCCNGWSKIFSVHICLVNKLVTKTVHCIFQQTGSIVITNTFIIAISTI